MDDEVLVLQMVVGQSIELTINHKGLLISPAKNYYYYHYYTCIARNYIYGFCWWVVITIIIIIIMSFSRVSSSEFN